MKETVLWHIALAAAQRLAAPLLGALIALLGDAAILDGLLSDELLDVLARSSW